ncbi:DUF2231 domain-containing protein, partial [Aetokthonos hydrillicola]
TPYPNIPAFLESDNREFHDSGIPSTVAIAGHPIHPILVQFPVAFLVGALLTDVVFWLTSSAFWAQASFWLIAGGLLGGVAAALTGILDFLRIERVRKRTAGWAHLILNASALVLTIVNLLLRLNNPVSPILPWGLILSVIIATLLGLSGWYGGELIYRHKIAVIGNGNPHYP